MSRLEDFLIGALLLIGVLMACALGIHHYGALQYESGYQTAIAAGRVERDRQADISRATENDLRASNQAKDTAALRRKQEYDQALADSQRRVRAGVDRLRCPASALQPGAAPNSGPAAATAATDGQGPDIVPEAAADLLGYGAAIAGLVSRYDEVIERYDACRAVNAK